VRPAGFGTPPRGGCESSTTIPWRSSMRWPIGLDAPQRRSYHLRSEMAGQPTTPGTDPGSARAVVRALRERSVLRMAEV